MNKKEVLELKRRFKKDAATFTKVCGCYVDGNHNKICKFANTFLNLEDDEYYKNCPTGYEIWSCMYCSKWTINLYYR